ncbi:TonB-dependent receptor [Marichromatium sp. PS1]
MDETPRMRTLGCCLAPLCWPLAAGAEPAQPLPAIEISATRIASDAGDYATTELDGATLEARGGAAQVNPYRALDLTPSVNRAEADPNALSTEQQTLRLRAIAASTATGLAVTIEGTPSSTSAGRGGVGNLYDLENLERLTLWRGPQPAGVGLGVGNLAGSLALGLRAPRQQPGVMARVARADHDFHRLFARLDSGTIGAAASRLFLSASSAAGEQWRGPGGQSRDTLNLGWAQPLGADLSLSLYGAHNRFHSNAYRPLTHAESQDLERYGTLGYHATLTGSAREDANYYAYNTQHYTEDNLLATLSWQLGPRARLQLRPYWLETRGERLTGKRTGITRVEVNQRQYGAVAELQLELDAATLTLGHWSQRLSSMPPPLSQRLYTVDAEGALRFSRWGILAEQGERAYESPFAMIEGERRGWRYTLGTRYLRLRLPAITGYDASALPDLDHGAALDLDPPVDPALGTAPVTLAAWLPSLSLSRELTPGLEARLALGRTIGNPWLGPLYSGYMNARERFEAAGIDLQSLWQRLRFERAETIEAGLRWRHGNLTLAPTLYWGRLRDKQVMAYDPALDLSYLQGGVRAHTQGAELEARWRADAHWNLVASLSWNRSRLDTDIRTAADSLLATRGNQVPDAPEWLASLALEYRHGPWTLTPVVRHVGRRYGDAANTEPVDAHTLFDLGLGYRHRAMSLSLAVDNLFDTRYVAVIDAGRDDAQPGTIGYYPGAPRTLSLTLTMQL